MKCGMTAEAVSVVTRLWSYSVDLNLDYDHQ